MDRSPANITQAESSGAEDRAASVAQGITLQIELWPQNRVLPDKLGEELWRVAGAATADFESHSLRHVIEKKQVV